MACKNVYVSGLSALATLLALPCQAQLPTSAISSLKISLYALYTTADPTCQTGLVATIPMSSTPQTVDVMANSAVASDASTSSTINCVIWVTQNTFSITYAAGSYTSTSSWPTASANGPDSVCNSGGSIASGVLRVDGSAVTWPSQISSDLAAKGLTGAATASSTADIVPIYVSTNSKCFGNYGQDATNTGCSTYANNFSANSPLQFPTAAGSTTAGIILSKAVSSDSNTGYKMVINPGNMVGGYNGACGVWGWPQVNFTTK